MKLPNNDAIVDNMETSNRRTPLSQRLLVVALIAMPCLLIVGGLFTGTPTEQNVSNIIYGPGGYLPTVIILVFLALGYLLLKNNPRLRRASKWTLQSYEQSVMGLDERERLVIDQAFRTSYRVMALICSLALLCVFINIDSLHLPYHPSAISVFYIMFGVVGLLTYLPLAVVAWREDV